MDPAAFAKEAIPPEIRALNASILVATPGTPTYREMGAAQAKAQRAEDYHHGEDRSRYEDIMIPANPLVGARVFFPDGSRDGGKEIQGVLLHVHGGGFVFGSAFGQNDTRLLRHADNCNLVIVSIDYRLSPEHVFPAALDDCIAAAMWMQTAAGRATLRIATPRTPLLCVGESAGGNLVASMLALLPRPVPFTAVCFVYGWFDLSCETPHCKLWGDKRLVLSVDDLLWFREQYVLENSTTTAAVVDWKDSKLSPLYADLARLPEALVVVGTEDPLLDDSLFFHARWIASGNTSTLEVYPGGAHGMGHFGPHQATAQGEQVLQRIEAFYEKVLNSFDHDGR